MKFFLYEILFLFEGLFFIVIFLLALLCVGGINCCAVLQSAHGGERE